MKRIVIPILLVALAALGIWWFSTSQVLKRRTASFIETANVPASMSDLGRGARGRHLADYLASHVAVDSPQDLADEVGREFSRDQAAALYSVVAGYCRRISITDLSFQDITVDGDAATVRFTADAIVELPNRRPVDGLVTVASHWRKSEGDWLLEAFGWTESQRP